MIQVACTKARKFGQKNSVARWILFRSLGWLYKVGLHGMLGTGGVHDNVTAQMRRLQCRQLGLGGSSVSTMMLHYSWWVQTAPAARSLQRYAPSLPYRSVGGLRQRLAALIVLLGNCNIVRLTAA